MENEGEERSGE
jgi:hypothetical protein